MTPPFHILGRLLAIWLVMAASALGQLSQAESDAVDEAVMAQMREQKLVGVAIGVIRDSKIVYTKGYGFADLERKKPATAETVFNWASNSKPLMAIAALQLVEQGRLDLDQPITRHMPDLPEHLHAITTRQLLCHQSGIPHYRNGKIVPTKRKPSQMQQRDPSESMQRFLMSPLIFEPGAKVDYSTHAYILLSAMVQAAGKQPLEKQLTERIVKPLKLESFQLDLPFKDQANWSHGYRMDGLEHARQADVAHFWKHGAGGYKSNIVDFARFAVAAMNSELIKKNRSAEMWTPQNTRDGEPTHYGLGWGVSGSGRHLKLSHNGKQGEARTRAVLYPNRNHGMVVMCNTAHCDPGKISTAIYKAMQDAGGTSK